MALSDVIHPMHMVKSIIFQVRYTGTLITQANIYLSYRKHDDIKRVEFYEKITSVDEVFIRMNI